MAESSQEHDPRLMFNEVWSKMTTRTAVDGKRRLPSLASQSAILCTTSPPSRANIIPSRRDIDGLP